MRGAEAKSPNEPNWRGEAKLPNEQEHYFGKPTPGLVLKSVLTGWSLAAVLLATGVMANSPPPPPSDWDAWSGNKDFVAHGDLAANKIVVMRIVGGNREPIWSVAPWQNTFLGQSVLLSDDGRSFVIFGDPWAGGGLDQPILHFYHLGKMVRHWTLADLFATATGLPTSVSHLLWSKNASLENETLKVTTADGRDLSFDMATGDLRARTPGK